MNHGRVRVKALPGGKYQLMFQHPITGLSPAGPRLLRLHPPSVQFMHDDKDAAIRDAMRLQKHIDESPSLRDKSAD